MDSLARLRDDPPAAAILLDVDGVLAPIVARPQDAEVPEGTRALLRELATRYALVACISGRGTDDVRRLVGVPTVVYVGNHGLDLDPRAAEWRPRLEEFLQSVTWSQVEDKGASAALHFRDAPDEESARRSLDDVAAAARAAGFVARYGRKVLEILPPVDVDKGTAVTRLLEERALRRALYAGDDTTDLDAFRALASLDVAVRIAVVSSEGPGELREAADVLVESTEQLVSLLERL